MQMSETIGELAKALAAAQGEIEGAKKDSENPFFKSKYADLSSVRDACQTALSKHGLAIVQIPGTQITENATIISVETLLAHSSGEWVRGDLSAIPVKDDPQGIGSCITYLRRYALSAYTGVAPEDDDGSAASRPFDGKAQAKPKGTPKPPVNNAAEVTELKKAVVDVCKLLNAAGDTPAWTAKRVDEFALNQFGLKADALEVETLRELVKKLSQKLDLVRKGSKSPEETERRAKIALIVKEVPTGVVDAELKANYEGKTLDSLSLDSLNKLHADMTIPF